MPAGKYRTRVTIQQPTASSKSDGQGRNTWAVYCKRWAADVSGKGDEVFVDGIQLQARASGRLEMPSDIQTREITTKMRVVIGSRVLEISDVKDVNGERREVHVFYDEKR